MKTILSLLIKGYQLAISPYFGVRCRFIPSCSEYMREAIAKKGSRWGLLLGLRRLSKCHPLGGSGYDPLSD